MQPLNLDYVVQYVNDNIDVFHKKRYSRLKKLKLKDLLKKKNPYLFKAKNVLTSEELVKTLFNAYNSSQEETIFGSFLEGLAIHVNQYVYGGIKSSAEGIDLEFEKDNVRYIVSIKSGPKWGNSSQIAKMKDNFRKARRILQTNNPKQNVTAINGCCYGKENIEYDEYTKYCGQAFWEFISGDPNLYINIIEPLGYKAKEKNEEFNAEYAKIINSFTFEFTKEYCEDGEIIWPRLVEFNSSK